MRGPLSPCRGGTFTKFGRCLREAAERFSTTIIAGNATVDFGDAHN